MSGFGSFQPSFFGVQPSFFGGFGGFQPSFFGGFGGFQPSFFGGFGLKTSDHFGQSFGLKASFFGGRGFELKTSFFGPGGLLGHDCLAPTYANVTTNRPDNHSRIIVKREHENPEEPDRCCFLVATPVGVGCFLC